MNATRASFNKYQGHKWDSSLRELMRYDLTLEGQEESSVIIRVVSIGKSSKPTSATSGGVLPGQNCNR